MKFSYRKHFQVKAGLSTRTLLLGFFAIIIAAGVGVFYDGGGTVSAQSSPSPFRVGEKLTYTISFARISNAGYAETYVISRGKISGKDAVELRGRVKTIDLVSAAFFLLDETRTSFAAPDSGLPHYVTTTSLGSVMPKETIRNYIAQPTSNFDLLTLLFKARESGGIGSFPLFEGEQMHTVAFQTAGAEKVKTEAGDFDTTGSIVQSEFLTSQGIKELKINFTSDEHRVPVLFRMKIGKNDLRVALSAITLPEPEAPSPTPSPTVAASPKPTANPKATPTPPQYVDNQPLIPELGFQIGEVLDYRVSSAGKAFGIVSLNARERKLVEKVDTLLLTATVTGAEAGNPLLKLGESANVLVDPETLAPIRLDSKFSTGFAGLNQNVTFDHRTGGINYGQRGILDAPIGTHSFLSLLYAMRSFNLKPSKDSSNPVNDTRVAVFWQDKSYVWTLRPAASAEITIGEEKIAAQMISINTGHKELDALNIKIWLRTEDRVPVKFSAGAYQAELVSTSTNLF